MDEEICILPPHPENRPVKIEFVNENEHFQHCNDCSSFNKYEHSRKLEYCVVCGSNNIR